MACFVAPMAEAVVVAIAKKVVEKKEQRDGTFESAQSEFTWSRKLGWLNKMLWGGVSLLALEHFWHGEIVPWPPFLTAMYDPSGVSPMLYEIATTGTLMAAFVTLVWGVMVLIKDKKAKTVHGKAQADI